MTSQFGRQRCPKCGVEVVVEDPRADVSSAYAPPNHPPAPEAKPDGSLELTPWERRGELGFFPALGQTFQAVFTKPTEFFSRIRYDTNGGSGLYLALVVFVPSLILVLYTWLGLKPKEFKEAWDQVQQLGLGQKGADSLFNHMMSVVTFMATPQGLVLLIASTLLYLSIALVLCVVIVHGALNIQGKATGGWPATFKATVYAATPFLFTMIPCCGGLLGALIAGTWFTGLQIYAITKAHHVTTTVATASVLALHATFALLVMLIVAGASFG